jgi:hypothetical protein
MSETIIVQIVTTVIAIAPMLIMFRVSIEHRLTKLETRMSILMERLHDHD